MKALRNYLDKIKPNFEEGGKFHAFRSVFDGFETFLFVPNATSKSGTHIHDSIDSKRIMSMVVIALVPALLFGMYNVGYQHFHATGAAGGFWEMFIYGFLAVLPKIIVSYVVGLGIEFVVAQWKKEEIQEGFLVSGILIPMIVPVDCPLWILAVATAFSVIFAKEVFGGTGMNVFNVALITRAFLFFAYPTKMSGDAVWVSGDSIFGLGQSVDGLTVATPLGAAATSGAVCEGRTRSPRDVLRIRRRCLHGMGVQCNRSRHSDGTDALVRTPRAGWFLLRCRVHGYRPRYIGTYRDR